MPLSSRVALLLALVLILGLITGPASALKRKNRAFPNKRLSLLSPLIHLDEEDQKSLGSVGRAFAEQNTITTRNPILLIPGTKLFFNFF